MYVEQVSWVLSFVSEHLLVNVVLYAHNMHFITVTEEM